jgi:AraC family transcriptional regulator
MNDDRMWRVAGRKRTRRRGWRRRDPLGRIRSAAASSLLERLGGSADGHGPEARPDYRAIARRWRDGYTPQFTVMHPPSGIRSERRFVSDLLVIGRFTASPDSPGFDTAGLINSPEFVFPRVSVWIEHEGEPPFVADPNCVTCYNAAQPYRRRAIGPQGDVCDWFKIRRDVLLQAVRAFDPEAEDETAPFRTPRMPADPETCLAERALFQRTSAGEIDAMEAEELAIALLVSILGRGRPFEKRDAAGSRGARRRRELIEQTKALLSREPARPRSLKALAEALGCSPFHLCRVFQRGTGSTLHAYRTQLRLRRALDAVLTSRSDLSELALASGFSHHSHFTWAFRRAFGVTPSEARRLLKARRAGELLNAPPLP